MADQESSEILRCSSGQWQDEGSGVNQNVMYLIIDKQELQVVKLQRGQTTMGRSIFNLFNTG